MVLLSGKHGLVIGNLIKVVTVYLLDHKIYDTVNKGSCVKRCAHDVYDHSVKLTSHCVPHEILNY